MADYDCAPLWWDQPDRIGEARPEELQLSEELRADLWAWAFAYDATLDRDNPAASGFSSGREEQAFHERGRSLALQVASELGSDAAVRYWPEN